jgi:MerR HTH family regulatory protein
LLSGRVTVFITRGDGYVTTVQAAEMVRVTPATIRKWKQRGHLEPVGLDERGNPLYRPGDVTAAEKSVQRNGIAASGVDPRRKRKSARALPDGLAGIAA